MNDIEELMSHFSDIDYVEDKRMPDGLKGLYFNDTVYLSPYQTHEEKFGTLAEEIGHYLTSVGDIIDYRSTESRKQERKARLVGATLIFDYEKLLQGINDGLVYDYELAEHLGITHERFVEGIQLLKESYGDPYKIKL